MAAVFVLGFALLVNSVVSQCTKPGCRSGAGDFSAGRQWGEVMATLQDMKQAIQQLRKDQEDTNKEVEKLKAELQSNTQDLQSEAHNVTEKLRQDLKYVEDVADELRSHIFSNIFFFYFNKSSF